MAFVHDQQEILREIVDQRKRRLSGFAPVKIARIVFDAVAIADFAHHLDVILRALLNSLRLDQAIHAFKLVPPRFSIAPDGVDGGFQLFTAGCIVRRGENRDMRALAKQFPCERIDIHDALHLVAEELHANRGTRAGDREDIQHISAGAEGAA
ncbi:hypothetical protein SDC9_193899 [bioreactor metagenome]|uniref:Uncharacterized protein n=1 Tax=bioreactor metagenome TaxID=1076179 RepID=A0A645IG20_9ZZZZ